MKNLFFITLYLLCNSIIANGQSFNDLTGVLTIDLSQSQQKLKIKVPHKRDIKIKIINFLPFTKYSIIAERTSTRVPPIDLDKFLSKQSATKDVCEIAQEAIIFKKVYTSTTELDLGANLRELEKKIFDCGGRDIITNATIKEELIRIPGLTQREFSLEELDSGGNKFLIVGEKITLKIVREATPALNIERKEFDAFEIATDTKGNWELNYGFAFKLNGLSSNKEYYSKADTGSTYLIAEKTKMKGLSGLNVYPTVFITYYPKHKELSSVFLGFTSGLGSNLEEISAFIAPSLVIEQNVLISLGLSITKSSVLRGEYSANQRVKENLNFDQLHVGRYMPNVFFSLSYRFNKNPFKKAKDSEE
ncbi:hypothetical protein [Emticicia sp. BO119]|uniref:hypothetical protein n=1 Tax=Emticicia sp. BO119 TaxID=2757768 RepID=UPI0015F08141|nr:hypothetical protein [Emticicia sp. BO119]MBA4852656.1 hypothetical protein [Emticicia sp. BO119]